MGDDEVVRLARELVDELTDLNWERLDVGGCDVIDTIVDNLDAALIDLELDRVRHG